MKGAVVPIKVIFAGNLGHAATRPAEHSHSLSTIYAKLMKAVNIHGLFIQNGWINWLVLIIAIFAGVALGRGLIITLGAISARLEKRGWHFRALLVSSLAKPANLFIFALALLIGLGQLRLNSVLRLAGGKVVLFLIAISIFWYLYNVVEMVELGLKRFIQRHETPLTEQVVPIIRKTLRAVVLIIAILFIAQNVFNRDIGSWLAGIGIAGLALSLAAQDSLKNLFGSITIFMDRPFLIGQQVIYQGFTGTVEDIGFRSTRLRLYDGTLVSVPNSDIVNTSVQNLSSRPFLRRFLTVGITYDAGVEKMQQAVQIIRDLLESAEFKDRLHNPDNAADYPPRVYFTDLATESLNIVIYYYYRPVSDYWGFMDLNQRFNLAMMAAFEKAGIEFSFPTRTVFLAGDPKRKLPVYLGQAGAQGDADSSAGFGR